MTDFFTYDRDSLLKHARFPLTIFNNETEVFTAIADDMVRTIHQNNEQNKKTVFIVPVGPVG
jgi:glucosamine-6-phosphate deaminase